MHLAHRQAKTGAALSHTAVSLFLACATLSSVCRATVVILPGGGARPYRGPPGASSLDDFYRRSASNEFSDASNNTQVLMSVFDNRTFQDVNQVLPSSESFVRGAIQAWAEHLHLVLRPDEVWFTILSQLFFYVSAHKADTVSLYQPRAPDADPMTLTDFEWFRVIQDFKYEAEQRCKADWLMRWAMPGFSTTTVVDEMTATVIMLGQNEDHPVRLPSNQTLACALPSVSLQGESDDWDQLLQKLDRLPAFGLEAAAYKQRLTPVLRRFIKSFAEPDSAATRAFWGQIVTASGQNPTCPGAASDRNTISGWLSAFFYWDADGKQFARLPTNNTSPDSTSSAPPTVVLDNVTYPALTIGQLPISYARAPFLIHEFNNTERYGAYVLAGTLGKQISPGAPDGYADALVRANQTGMLASVNSTIHSALQPLSAWMLYGPANFSATEQRWVTEPELVDLANTVQDSSRARYHCPMQPAARSITSAGSGRR